ncbi:hypothetical protein, partial [Sutterella wadsworthensis]|uniref:hypothetical protein n=1 Tax=Sutterella wadsworthensis TaxID=40545 RepID=UPI0019D28AD1
GLLSHFLRYVHGVDSVCVQKIHTTSNSTPLKSPTAIEATDKFTSQARIVSAYGFKLFKLNCINTS